MKTIQLTESNQIKQTIQSLLFSNNELTSYKSLLQTFILQNCSYYHLIKPYSSKTFSLSFPNNLNIKEQSLQIERKIDEIENLQRNNQYVFETLSEFLTKTNEIQRFITQLKDEYLKDNQIYQNLLQTLNHSHSQIANEVKQFEEEQLRKEQINELRNIEKTRKTNIPLNLRIIDKQYEEMNENEITNQLKEYKKLKELNNSTNQMNEIISEKQKKQLEDWTNLKYGEILYDSNIHYFNDNEGFYKMIIGKKQLLFIIQNHHKETFGYFLNNEINEIYRRPCKADRKCFHFNIEAEGSVDHPVNYPIKQMTWGGYQMKGKFENELIRLGDIRLFFRDNKFYFICSESNNFSYKGVANGLCGITSSIINEKYYCIPKRIVIVQMN